MSSQEEGVFGDDGLFLDITSHQRAKNIRQRGQVGRTSARTVFGAGPAFISAAPAIARAAGPILRGIQAAGARVGPFFRGPTGRAVGAGAAAGVAGGAVTEIIPDGMGGMVEVPAGARRGARFAVVDLFTGVIIKRISNRKALLMTRSVKKGRARTRIVTVCPACGQNPCGCIR